MKISLFTLVFIIFWLPLFSQTVFDSHYFDDIFLVDIDVKRNVSQLNKIQQIELFNKLFEIDQKHRIILDNFRSKVHEKQFNKQLHIMAENDKALQIVFDKLLKKYQWTSQKLIEPYKIWTIIWHATEHGVKKTNFYIPIIKEAFRNNHLEKEFYNNIISQLKYNN